MCLASAMIAVITKPMTRLPTMIRVLIVDAHPLYRDGVARMVRQRPAFQLAGEAGDASSAIELLERLRPDVAVVDPAMSTRVVLLAGVIRPAEDYDAIVRGAMAYLSKHATGDEIERAIGRAARGQATIAPELQTGVTTQMRLRQRAEKPTLSARELQVLERVADGCSAREIAAEFIVAPSTVRTHVQRVCDKLGVHDRAAAVAVGMRLGLLD
jgi:two-component system, NarL family, nitrate/nitrite response regulator NarL